TAAGIAEAWTGPVPALEVCEPLAPASRPKKFARALRDMGERMGQHTGDQRGDSIAAVGHMPDIAELAAWLIGSKKVHLDFSKAGIACIALGNEAKKGEGVLQWLITDAWLVEHESKEYVPRRDV